MYMLRRTLTMLSLVGPLGFVKRGPFGRDPLHECEIRFAAVAANEAEKAANLNILEVRSFGSFGRVYLGGEEQDIMAGYGAAVAAIEAIEGRPIEAKKR